MKVLVYGSGAVGLSLGAALIESGLAEVTFLTRPGRHGALQTRGVERQGIFGNFHAAPSRFNVTDDIATLRGQEFDYILVCVKSFESETTAMAIAENISGAVILFHNGWGSRDIFARYIAPERIFNARVITGFARIDDHIAKVTVHADDIRIGNATHPELSGSLTALAVALAKGNIPCAVTDEISRYMWSKMLYNCALNPLGAVLGVSYGLLADDPHARRIMDSVIDEIYDVMNATDHSAHWDTPDEYRAAFYCKMIPPTYNHESSMLQDIRAGRRTEIDFLSGAIVRLAAEKGLSVPTNALLLDMVRFLEKRP